MNADIFVHSGEVLIVFDQSYKILALSPDQASTIAATLLNSAANARAAVSLSPAPTPSDSPAETLQNAPSLPEVLASFRS